jgi:MFS family permease
VRVLLVLLICTLIFFPGCVAFGRASWNAFDWAGSVFPPNPASLVPYWFGFVLFGIAASPLDLVSWPLTALFFPDEKEQPSREFYWFSVFGPSVFLGVGGGTILGAIFYPFGLPFMSEQKDWNEAKAPSDDEPLPPAPGGKNPPK